MDQSKTPLLDALADGRTDHTVSARKIPAVVPGELLDDAVINYLRAGQKAGMALPNPVSHSGRLPGSWSEKKSVPDGAFQKPPRKRWLQTCA